MCLLFLWESFHFPNDVIVNVKNVIEIVFVTRLETSTFLINFKLIYKLQERVEQSKNVSINSKGSKNRLVSELRDFFFFFRRTLCLNLLFQRHHSIHVSLIELHLIERFLSLDDSSFQFVLLIQSRAETLYYHNTVEIFIRSFLCLRLASWAYLHVYSSLDKF